MNIKISVLLFFVTGMIISCCGLGQVLGPTSTPLRVLTPTHTNVSVPTLTSTLELSDSTYNPVPRWMILAQPGYDIEIFGEDWNYTDDRWGETYACIDYTRVAEPYLFFEQCFAQTQPDLTFESQRDSFLNDDFETLTPADTFGEVGQISLLAKRLEDNSTTFIKFFEIIGIGNYIWLVEMNYVTDDPGPLQSIYESQAANIIDYVLQNGLEKSRLIARPTATPLSPTQEGFYTSLAANLITDPEASVLYGSTWEALGDFVSSTRAQVCRDFEDRTNADVFWVRMSNCISTNETSFEMIVNDYKQSGDVLLESSHEYDDKFVMYGYQDGHTYFYAFLLHDEYVYFVNLESRTLSGQSVEDVFTQAVDDFLYGVLMVNVQK